MITSSHIARYSEPQYSNSVKVPLATPSFDTLTLTQAALAGLRSIYREGYDYKKAGVMLMDFVPADRVQPSLFDDPGARSPAKSEALKATMDSLNRRFGRGALKLGVEGVQQDWKMKRGNVSPQYTTAWSDVIRVRA